MAKLRDLVRTVAAALGDPEPSVNVLAMQLRKAGLIRSKGRGLNAADMTPADATALLVSCMVGGLAIETSQTTKTVLSIPSDPEKIYDCGNLCPELLQQLNNSKTFGDTIQVIISYIIEFSAVDALISIKNTPITIECIIEMRLNEACIWANAYETIKESFYRMFSNTSGGLNAFELGNKMKSTRVAIGKFILLDVALTLKGSRPNVLTEKA